MQSNTIKRTFLVLILGSIVSITACGKNSTPTSPTQPGPTVSTPAPTPAPTTPAPTPTPPPTPQPPSDAPKTSVTGTVFNLTRSGANDLDIDFRIDSFTVVKARAGTPVISGGQTFNTDAIRNGQGVTAEGTRTAGDSRGDFLIASRITINSQ
jgi:hypothetical protein